MYLTTMAKPATLLSLLEILIHVLPTALSKQFKDQTTICGWGCKCFIENPPARVLGPTAGLHFPASYAVGCGHVTRFWPMGCDRMWYKPFPGQSFEEAGVFPSDYVFLLRCLEAMTMRPLGGWWGHKNERLLSPWREDRCPPTRNAHWGLKSEQEIHRMMSSNWSSYCIGYCTSVHPNAIMQPRRVKTWPVCETVPKVLDKKYSLLTNLSFQPTCP